jgi:ubiquinone/menaquinone biosynthesis C-methylase UbiE
MKYKPVLTEKQIEDNHKIFYERYSLYRKKGLDFLKNREFILEKAGSLGGSILDIGSGKGIMALALAKAGYDLISVDKNEETLRIAELNLAYEKLLSKVDFYVMDAYSLVFDNESFNNVFMVEALHHMDDMNALFSEIDRVLSPRGKFVLADFNDKGMDIVDIIHRNEGRSHDSFSVGREEAINWLENKRYSLKRYEQECHWLLVADKGL